MSGQQRLPHVLPPTKLVAFCSPTSSTAMLSLHLPSTIQVLCCKPSSVETTLFVSATAVVASRTNSHARPIPLVPTGIGRLVAEAQSREAPVQRLADAVAGRFCYGVMAASALTFAFWQLIGGYFGWQHRIDVVLSDLAPPRRCG